LDAQRLDLELMLSGERLGLGAATETLSHRSTFRPQFHSPGHLFRQLMLRHSITKSSQINALNLVGKID
jgi:hypothetical protein